MPELAAIAFDGPKGVGKTATASRRARTVYRLDTDEDANALRADWKRVTADRPPVLIDEWQRLPQIWDVVRRAVDDGAAPGSFLLTGSATPPDAPVHSGAARIDRLRLRPLSLVERQLAPPTVSLASLLAGETASISGDSSLTVNDYLHEVAASGFPGIRGLSPRARRLRLDGYIRNMVERDFAQQGLTVRRPDTLLRWLRAYGAATATNASYAAIIEAATRGDSERPAVSRAVAYRDVLQSLWLLDELSPWDPGDVAVGPLAKTPRHFLADPALAVRLLGLDEASLSRPRPSAFSPRYGSLTGRLFEALVLMSVRAYAARDDASVSYLRTARGTHEVDIVVQRGTAVVGIEVKTAVDVTRADVKHLLWLRTKLGDDFAAGIIVNTGRRAYTRQDGIAVVPAVLLGP
jgi:predicted AAA+ superfamily ATPase